LYPKDPLWVQLEKKINLEQARRKRIKTVRRWRVPAIATLCIALIVALFVVATQPYWKGWQEALLPPTATPIQIPTPTPPAPIDLHPAAYYCAAEIKNTSLEHEYVNSCHNVVNDNKDTLLDFWRQNKQWLGNPITEALLDSATNNISQYFQYGLVEFKPNQPDPSRNNTHFYIFLLGNDLASCYSGIDFTNFGNNQSFDNCRDSKTKQLVYKLPKPGSPIDPDFTNKLNDAAKPVSSVAVDDRCLFYNLRSHYVCDSHGFRTVYDNAGGVPFMGVPITEEFQANYHGRPVWIQFFERMVLVSDPGANNGQAYRLEIGKSALEDIDGSSVENTFPPTGTTVTATPVGGSTPTITSNSLTPSNPSATPTTSVTVVVTTP
jgi:hypothetical protein